MAEHVAILHHQYIRLILDGIKTIESRLTVRPLAPFGKIDCGERIYFKVTSGPYMATAIADQIDQRDNLTPAIVQQMREQYNDAVCGDDAYWQWKSNSRYATFIALRDVRACSRGPALPPSRGLAWFVVPTVTPAHDATTCDAPLTAGGIRNGYVRLPSNGPFPVDAYATADAPGHAITLVLPDGLEVHTDIRADRMIRWRGWRPLFAASDARAGDVASFAALGRRRYAVSIMRTSHEPRPRQRSAEAASS